MATRTVIWVEETSPWETLQQKDSNWELVCSQGKREASGAQKYKTGVGRNHDVEPCNAW